MHEPTLTSRTLFPAVVIFSISDHIRPFSSSSRDDQMRRTVYNEAMFTDWSLLMSKSGKTSEL